MKEEKISIGMKDVDNPSLAVGRGSLLNCPRPSFLDFKFEIPFQLPSTVYLLLIGLSCFVSPILLPTEQSVINYQIFCLVLVLLFKTFIFVGQNLINLHDNSNKRTQFRCSSLRNHANSW